MGLDCFGATSSPYLFRFVHDRVSIVAGDAGPAFHSKIRLALDKILKGTKPTDLPVSFPAKFLLIIIVATAKALGIPYRRHYSPARRLIKPLLLRCV